MSTITHKRDINLVGFFLGFLEIDELKNFDIILGKDSLNKMKAKINLFNYSISFTKVANHSKSRRRKLCARNTGINEKES